MAVMRTRKSIGGPGSGISLTVLTDKKLKTSSFIIHFITELTEENAAANASVPFVIEDSCRDYPSITSFGRRASELYGAVVRGGISRFADSQVITVSASCISDKYALEGEEISYETLKLLCGCIFEPVLEDNEEKPQFRLKEFALKKQELIDDIDADINDKRIYAIKQASRIIFEGESAGIPLKGERKYAEGLTAEDSYAAYERLLKSAKIEIIFVGTELSKKCEELLTDRFVSINRENIFDPETIPSKPKTKPKTVTERLDVAQSKMVMAYKSEAAVSEADVPVIRVFNGIFGSTPFSMLFKNVREKMSLCYYCSSSYCPKKEVIYIDCGVESGNIEAARSEIENQLSQAAAGNISDELFEQAKLAYICALKSVEDSPKKAADWYFSFCLDGEEKTYTPAKFIELVRAVTKEQVIAYAGSLKLDTVYVLTGNKGGEEE